MLGSFVGQGKILRCVAALQTATHAVCDAAPGKTLFVQDCIVLTEAKVGEERGD